MNQNHLHPYDGLSKAFHWVTAIMVVAAFVLGPEHFGRLLRSGVDLGTQNDLVWHETLGMAIFVTTLLRLVWVVLRPTTPRVAMAAWMRWVSNAVHVGLWALMLALPLTALLTLGTEGAPLTLLGGVRVQELPFLANASWADFADWGEVHQFLGDAIIWLAGAHAVAALFHHFKLKDGVLASMLPWYKGRG